jgi:hypothetical protein
MMFAAFMALVKACEYYTVNQGRDALVRVAKDDIRIHPGQIETFVK